jgi:hypothetical protein
MADDPRARMCHLRSHRREQCSFQAVGLAKERRQNPYPSYLLLPQNF